MAKKMNNKKFKNTEIGMIPENLIKMGKKRK